MAAAGFVMAGASREAGSVPVALSRRPPETRRHKAFRHAVLLPAPCRASTVRDASVSGTAFVVGGTTAAIVAMHAVGPRRRQSRAPKMPRWRCTTACGATEPPVVLEVRGVGAVSADEERKQILKGLDLTVREGEVHAVMGPNGSGKSTLSKVLIGDSSYEVNAGEATFAGKSLFDLDPHERALEGLFLAFQSPPAIGGVSNLDFLRAAYNAQRRAREEPELDVIEFYGLCTQKLEQLRIDPDFLNRNVNEGFSGGERKRNEMLQMSVLEPRLAILDEIDSGLDVDALRDVADAITRVREADKKRSMILVTHFERFLDYVNPDYVHVMYKGRIVKSGGRELGHKLDAEGYDWVIEQAEAAIAAET